MLILISNAVILFETVVIFLLKILFLGLLGREWSPEPNDKTVLSQCSF
jgi:hypothetical protein